MLAIFQIFTIFAMVLATYLIYQSLGARRPCLLFTREEKVIWDNLIRGRLGNWLTRTNIFATLTSLATVYVFFIGNTYSFGFWVIAPLITMALGAFVTVHVSKIIQSRRRITSSSEDTQQTSSVILDVFWNDDDQSKLSTKIIKIITLASIFSILWLDFTVFADISNQLIGHNSLVVGAVTIFFCAAAVLHFTLKYGLRGFVFADLFQSPLIILGSLIILIGSIVITGNEIAHANGQANYAGVIDKIQSLLLTPQISWESGILFSISCLFLNSFLILVTPPHWLRLWAFHDKEITLQISSVLFTVFIWAIIILIGSLASVYANMNGMSGTSSSIDVAVNFLRAISSQGSSLFAVAFWIAGMAALFASADIQIYSGWLIASYNADAGVLEPDTKLTAMPLLYASAGAAMMTLIYVSVRLASLPFDRLVLVLLPSCLTITPSLVLTLKGARQRPILLLISVAAYVALSVSAIMSSRYGEMLAVAAPIAPLLVSAAAYFFIREVRDGADDRTG